jgi:hypothetical protein
MIAIDRFADGRIAEDWGVWSDTPWQAPAGEHLTAQVK